MAAFGIPSEVLVGLAVGGSASFIILAELPSESPLAKVIMRTRTRRILISSAITGTIGLLTDPITGLVAELIVYPAFCIKGRSVKKQLDKICDEMKPGESRTIRFQGWTHKLIKKPIST
jgi:hypothetical protein